VSSRCATLDRRLRTEREWGESTSAGECGRKTRGDPPQAEGHIRSLCTFQAVLKRTNIMRQKLIASPEDGSNKFSPYPVLRRLALSLPLIFRPNSFEVSFYVVPGFDRNIFLLDSLFVCRHNRVK
jgi:hypothetical protein